LSFAPGETSKAVIVPIIGDTAYEADEVFYLNLSAASNAAISRGQGIGTILNDDLANRAPTALTVSTTAFNENIPAGTAVTTLGTSDPDSDNTFSYSLVAGDGDTDNAAFSIAGNQLLIKASPNFEAKSSYNLRIRSTDQGGLSVDRALTFSVNDLNEGPVITDVSDNVGLIQGSVAAGGRTDDTTPTISGTLSAALAASTAPPCWGLPPSTTPPKPGATPQPCRPALVLPTSSRPVSLMRPAISALRRLPAGLLLTPQRPKPPLPLSTSPTISVSSAAVLLPAAAPMTPPPPSAAR
jgi:hypothetical protein